MLRTLKEYIDEGSVERQRQDPSQAMSLMDKAGRRLAFAQRQIIDESDAEFVFEDAYDVVREATHAIMVAEGLKPLTHEPIAAFMQDVLFLSPEIVERFDSYRKLRNKSLYAARRISTGKVREARDFAAALLPELNGRMRISQHC